MIHLGKKNPEQVTVGTIWLAQAQRGDTTMRVKLESRAWGKFGFPPGPRPPGRSVVLDLPEEWPV